MDATKCIISPATWSITICLYDNGSLMWAYWQCINYISDIVQPNAASSRWQRLRSSTDTLTHIISPTFTKLENRHFQLLVHLPAICSISDITVLKHPLQSYLFNFIFTARGYAKRGICRRRVSVCLSVTLRYCIKTAKRRITQTTPYDSPMTLVFRCQRSWRNSNGITPYGGDKCRWGGLKLVTFDEEHAIARKRYKIDV